MAKTKRDRLDGDSRKNFLLEFFLFPGRVTLWLNYMFPKKGYTSARTTARHARSPIMTFIYSIMFWALIGYIGYMYYIAELN